MDANNVSTKMKDITICLLLLLRRASLRLYGDMRYLALVTGSSSNMMP